MPAHVPVLFFLCCLPLLVRAQETEEPPKVTLNGYVKDLFSLNHQPLLNDWLVDNVVHNRLSFRYFPAEGLTVALEARNRLFYGQTVENFAFYPEFIEQDPGIVDLSCNWLQGDNWFVHTIADRAFVDYTSGKWQIRAGRQRINWGRALVWNPNDVFNAYSFFDFDYEERPGSDAVLARYYTGATSSAELAVAAGDSLQASTVAGMFRFNKWYYDFQVLAGKVRDDLVLGAGWSGQIGGAAFRGEMTWLQPFRNRQALDPAFVAVLSADYTFPSSLYLQSEVIYNSAASAESANFFDLTQQLTVRNLNLVKFSIFGSLACQFTPLWRASLGGIWNPGDRSAFLSPSVDVSLSDNFGLLLIGQVFLGAGGSLFGQAGSLFFTRLKWSF